MRFRSRSQARTSRSRTARSPIACATPRAGCRHSGSGVAIASRILSENRPEWAIADYACLTAGLTDVPIYPTLPADQIAYILNDSGAVAIFVSNAEQAAKIAADPRRRCRRSRHVIGFDDVRRSRRHDDGRRSRSAAPTARRAARSRRTAKTRSR